METYDQPLEPARYASATARGLEDLFEAQAETGDAPAHRLLIVLAWRSLTLRLGNVSVI